MQILAFFLKPGPCVYTFWCVKVSSVSAESWLENGGYVFFGALKDDIRIWSIGSDSIFKSRRLTGWSYLSQVSGAPNWRLARSTRGRPRAQCGGSIEVFLDPGSRSLFASSATEQLSHRNDVCVCVCLTTLWLEPDYNLKMTQITVFKSLL